MKAFLFVLFVASAAASALPFFEKFNINKDEFMKVGMQIIAEIQSKIDSQNNVEAHTEEFVPYEKIGKNRKYQFFYHKKSRVDR